MKAYKNTLPNGLRVISIPLKDARAVAVYVLVETGTKYEDKNQNGISHFLEHVCFKGTKKRLSAHHINTELDSIGAQTNAFTSYEFTGYYAKAHPKHLPKIMDVLSDIYLNSTFPKEEIEREKGVIIEEINMYEDLPKRRVQDLFQELLYGDQPAGWSVIGKKEVIKRTTSDDFKKYRDKHYVAEGTIIVVSGNFNKSEILPLVKKSFKDLPVSKKGLKKRVIEKQPSPKFVLFPKISEQTHIVLGLRAFSAKDKRVLALSVLNTLLGEGMSSRLFQKLREELGICYYVRSSLDEYTDHGVLAISAGVDPNRSVQAIEAILAELRSIRDGEIGEIEIKKAKEYMIGTMYLGLETSDALAGYYGLDEIIRGKTKSPQELEREIRNVSMKDIKKVAKDVINDKNLNLAVLGKVPKRSDIKRILKI